MESFLKVLVQLIQPTDLAVQLAIPSKLDNPDYESYARNLGKEGVNRLGKMDYILLGMYSILRIFSEPQEAPNFVELLCKGAELIRTRMHAAVSADS